MDPMVERSDFHIDPVNSAMLAGHMTPAARKTLGKAVRQYHENLLDLVHRLDPSAYGPLCTDIDEEAAT